MAQRFQARTEPRDVHGSVYSGGILAIFSVDSYTLKSKHGSTENSEVAFICICFLFFKLKGIYSETTFCSDLAKPVHTFIHSL